MFPVSMLDLLLVILVSYLWGAFPSAYVVGRYALGIDIRRYGSGNVGASNIYEFMGFWTGLGLGIFDCVIKGVLPVLTARMMDQGLSIQASAGLLAIAGHNWSPYIRFTGGRGIATAIGVLIGLAMWKELLTIAIMGVAGRVLFRDIGLWTIIATLTLPLMTLLFQQPIEITYTSIAISMLLVLKRLTANWEKPSDDCSLPKMLVFRFLWDRDVRRREDWTNRLPPAQ